MCQLMGPRGTSGVMETTEVPLSGFGGSWVKAALPLSLVGRSNKMLVCSPSWQSGCWSMFFYSHLRKEIQIMVISCSGKGLPEWDMYLAGQVPVVRRTDNSNDPLPEFSGMLLMLTGAAYAPRH